VLIAHKSIRALPEKIINSDETDLLRSPLEESGSGEEEPMIQDGGFDTRKFCYSGNFVFGRSKADS
jgi:hypothetical protein